MGKVLFKGDTADAPEAGGLTRHRPASPQGCSRGAGHRRTASGWGAGDVTAVTQTVLGWAGEGLETEVPVAG